jgi:hypothetical protein
VLPRGFSRIRVSKKCYIANETTGVGEGGWWQEKIGLLNLTRRSMHDKETWKGVGAHSKSELIVDFPVPIHAYSVKNGVLIDVSYAIKVCVIPEAGYSSFLISKEMPSKPRCQLKSFTQSAS